MLSGLRSAGVDDRTRNGARQSRAHDGASMAGCRRGRVKASEVTHGALRFALSAPG